MAQMSIHCCESAHPQGCGAGGINERALIALRFDMLRFARQQLNDQALAEDLVQEAIEAALRKSSSFAGNSTLKTWIFAILRNRIIDHSRRASRTVNLSTLVAEDADLADCQEDLFNNRHFWHEGTRPTTWPTPDEALQSQRFRAALEVGLKALPAQSRRVFMMREVLGLDACEISSQLGISLNNCHVILHRARTRLRAVLKVELGRDFQARGRCQQGLSLSTGS